MDDIAYLKEKVRDIELNFLKKDDREYKAYLDKVDSIEDTCNDLKLTFRGISNALEKNNSLTDALTIQNTRIATILETLTNDVKETKSDIKGLNTQLNRIDKDSALNTDNRVTEKQMQIAIVAGIVLAIFSFIFGASIANNGKKEGDTKVGCTTTITKQLAQDSTQRRVYNGIM